MSEFSDLLENLPEELKQLAGSFPLGKGKTLPEGIEERINLKLISILATVEEFTGTDLRPLEAASMSIRILKNLKEAF